MPPSIATTDLHDELIRHRRGEYSHITIERHRERLRNIEGRNLKQDFESLAPAREAPTVHVVRPPSTQHALGVYGTCTTSLNGGLARQVPAPSVGEV
jgi:hypothetical protein